MVQLASFGHQGANQAERLVRSGNGFEHISLIGFGHVTLSILDSHSLRVAEARLPLSACVGLTNRPTGTGVGSFFWDSPWQPGPEAVDAIIQGCALQHVASLKIAREACDQPRSSSYDETSEDRPRVGRLRCPSVTAGSLPAPMVEEKLRQLHCRAELAGYTKNTSLPWGGGQLPMPAVRFPVVPVALARRAPFGPGQNPSQSAQFRPAPNSPYCAPTILLPHQPPKKSTSPPLRRTPTSLPTLLCPSPAAGRHALR